MTKMMYKKFSFLAIALVLLGSCSRDESFNGPSLTELYGDLSVLESLQVSNKNVDFENGQTSVFSARFSKTVDWELHIIGQESGAEKVITGKSKVLDSDNANWNGSTTNLPLFKSEKCLVNLILPEDSISFMDSLTIVSTKVNEGLLLADFENGVPSGWGSFAQSGADMSFFTDDEDISGQGSFYYDMGGEVDWDWLIGYLDIKASAYGTEGFDLNPNADNVYFNCLLYVPQGVTNEVVLFQFREDDDQNGSFTEGSEDMYSVELKGLDQGWQKVSIKYSELQALVNGAPAEAAGNKVLEPAKLSNIWILMLANPSSGYSQVYLDYVIFTEGKALNP